MPYAKDRTSHEKMKSTLRLCWRCVLLLAFVVVVLSLISQLQLITTRFKGPSFELDSHEKAEVEEYRAWFQNCEHLLLDLGANRGDTILRWLTEEKYSGRSRISSIDTVYSLEHRKKFCILSFEPNGMFESTLRATERRMCAEGFKVKVKICTAVSDRFSESVIYIDDISTHSYGSSLIPEKKVNFAGQLHSLGKEQAVKLVDMRAILSRVPESTELVVKMDIEGGEYDVLRSMIPSGLVCSINVLIIEYHDHKLRKGAVPAGINGVIEWILGGERCGVQIIHDD